MPSISRLFAGIALAAALLVPASPPTAAPSSGSSHFDIHIAGIRAGELSIQAARDGAQYETGGRIRATGLLGAIFRLRFEGTSVGAVAPDGRIVPERYVATARSARSERTTDLQFENGDPARLSVVPPRRRPIDPAAQRGTIDPLSAAYSILLDTEPSSICNTRMDLFDGSRRALLEVGRAENRDGVLVCNGRYVRLEGDTLAVSDDEQWGFQLFYRPLGNGTVELQRIETPTRYGWAVMTRRS